MGYAVDIIMSQRVNGSTYVHQVIYSRKVAALITLVIQKLLAVKVRDPRVTKSVNRLKDISNISDAVKRTSAARSYLDRQEALYIARLKRSDMDVMELSFRVARIIAHGRSYLSVRGYDVIDQKLLASQAAMLGFPSDGFRVTTGAKHELTRSEKDNPSATGYGDLA